MVKLTVIYDNPKDPSAFEKGYPEHIELAKKLGAVKRMEFAKVFPKEDKSPTPAYRVAELYFESYDSAVAAFGTPEGKALFANAQQLATGGAKMLLSDVEQH